MQLKVLTYGDPARPAVLIVHGLLGLARNWSARAKVLAERYFVIVPDLRNHGDSPHSDAFDYQILVDDLLHVLDRHLVAKVHVLGHSMGAKAAMGLALFASARVMSLIAVDMAPKRYEHDLDGFVRLLRQTDLRGARSRVQIERRLEAQIPQRAVRLFLLTNLAPSGDGFRWKPNLAALEANYAEISQAIDDIFPDRRYTGPSLFLRGERSNYVLEQDREHITALFPKARFVTIKGAGHWPHSDRPEVFDQIVGGFLAGSA